MFVYSYQGMSGPPSGVMMSFVPVAVLVIVPVFAKTLKGFGGRPIQFSHPKLLATAGFYTAFISVASAVRYGFVSEMRTQCNVLLVVLNMQW